MRDISTVRENSDRGRSSVSNVLAVLGTVVTLTACGGGPAPELLAPALAPSPWRPATAVDVEELTAAANIWTSTAFAACGELRLQAVEGGELGTWEIDLLLTRSGGVRLQALAAGRSFEMASNGDRWWVRDLDTGILYAGPASGEAAFDERAAYLALRPLDLVEALLPQPVPDALEGSRALVIAGEDQGGRRLVWLQRDAMGDLRIRRELWLAPATLRLVRLVDFDPLGVLRQEVRYGDYPEGSETRPRSIEIRVPRASVRWRLTLNQSATEVQLAPGIFRLLEGPGEAARPLPSTRGPRSNRDPSDPLPHVDVA